eukprot:GAHX01002833.1.p1 GENE.GAHX01002833.1~~GAHX01002833.1.p1  ORF type:complete len:282 (+),score=65.32 GAHX01002833.1:41-886(+)
MFKKFLFFLCITAFLYGYDTNILSSKVSDMSQGIKSSMESLITEFENFKTDLDSLLENYKVCIESAERTPATVKDVPEDVGEVDETVDTLDTSDVKIDVDSSIGALKEFTKEFSAAKVGAHLGTELSINSLDAMYVSVTENARGKYDIFKSASEYKKYKEQLFPTSSEETSSVFNNIKHLFPLFVVAYRASFCNVEFKDKLAVLFGVHIEVFKRLAALNVKTIAKESDTIHNVANAEAGWFTKLWKDAVGRGKEVEAEKERNGKSKLRHGLGKIFNRKKSK